MNTVDEHKKDREIITESNSDEISNARITEICKELGKIWNAISIPPYIGQGKTTIMATCLRRLSLYEEHKKLAEPHEKIYLEINDSEMMNSSRQLYSYVKLMCLEEDLTRNIAKTPLSLVNLGRGDNNE